MFGLLGVMRTGAKLGATDINDSTRVKAWKMLEGLVDNKNREDSDTSAS